MNTEIDLDTKRKELLRDYLPICAGNLANAKMCVENELVRLGLIKEPFEDPKPVKAEPKAEVKAEPKTETHDDVTNVEWVNEVKSEVKVEVKPTTKKGSKGKRCEDHLGIEYATVTEMCATYKMPIKTYCERRRSGWSVEKALTTPVNKRMQSVGKKRVKHCEVIKITQADVEKACKNANTESAASLPKETKSDKPLEPIVDKVTEKVESTTEPKQELKPTCPAIVVDSSKDEIQSVKLTQEQEKEVDNLLPYGPANPTPNDPVNHPSHYSGKVECIDCIESAVSGLDGFHGFCAGNAIKYLFRFSRKNGIEDLRKAEWYIDRLIKAIPGRHE